jgi:PAS domain S-box-containing protein
MPRENSGNNKTETSSEGLIRGESQMADLIRAYDWSATPLGEIAEWPEALLWSANLMLACAFPSLVFWGAELVQLYNDAFIPLLAERHPSGLGQRAADCWWDAWQIVGPNLDRVMNGEETVYYENAVVPIVRDGRLQDIRWTYNYSPIWGPGGKVMGVLVLCQDITREVAATQELRESEARTSRVLQSIGDAVVVTDAKTRITQMNPVAEQLTGWTMEEASGKYLKDVFQIVNEASGLPVESPADKVVLTGTVASLANHTILISQDGRRTAIDDSGAPIRDDNGELTGIVVVFRNMEERRAAERKLNALAESLRRVFAATTDAVAAIDRSWRFSFLNENARNLLAPAGDVLGKNLWETFPATLSEGSPYREHYYRAMNEGIASEFEVFYPAPLSTWFQIIVRPTPDGIVLFFRDVKNRRRAERNLELLSDSGRALAQSLDFETTLRNVARIAVRSFSDFCYFDLVQPDGTIKRIVHLHRDPAQQTFLDAARRAPLIPNPNHPVNRTLISKEPTIIEGVTDEWLRLVSLSDEHLEAMRQLGFHSLLTVPIVNGDDILGTLSFGRTANPEIFTKEDSAVAMELSQRVSAALVNVSLYRAMREAQAVARIERERLRDLFMQAPAPILTMHGPDHIVTLANEGYVRLLRKGSESELIGKSLREVAPELEGQGFFELLDEVYRTGSPYRGNEVLAYLENKATGKLDEAWFNFVYQPARNTAGAVDGILVFAIEITEQVRSRKEAEFRGQLLERQSSELETIYKTAPIGLALFDPIEFRYLRLNDTQAQIVGLPANEILGKTLTEIAPIEGLNEMFQQVAEGRPIQNALLEGVLPAQPDTHRSWTVNYYPVYGEDGTVQAITAASLEITAQKRAEQALIQSEKIAAVGRLASSIAHEINNPLESVTNLLYLARYSHDVAEIHGHLEIADRELRRISLIANQTLRFYRQSTRPQAIQCGALIDSVLTLYQGRLLNSNIQVERRERVNQPLVCFEGEIRQVLNNLVGNALDAMPRGGRLSIRSRAATNWTTAEPGWTLTFADTGTGVPGDIQKRIFEPFFTTKGMSGTGLGLWISKDIIEKHHGSIRLRSSQRPGKSGSVFSVFLPFHSVRDERKSALQVS